MKVKIYNDIGVSKESLAHCFHSLKLHLPIFCQISYVSAQEILSGYGLRSTDLFVLPGGRDLYYKQSLQGKGNSYIQQYVRDGGSFLGICAGAYYSGNYLVFAPKTPIEVVGPRELGLFQGVVKGPVLAPYYYNSYKGASAARIILKHDIAIKDCYIFYNGGGYFVNPHSAPNTVVIGCYGNGKAAIIRITYGAGNVILSGVHMEYDSFIMHEKSFETSLATLRKHDSQRVVLFKYILRSLGIYYKSQLC